VRSFATNVLRRLRLHAQTAAPGINREQNFAMNVARRSAHPLRHRQRSQNASSIRVIDTAVADNLDGERKTVTALFADIKGSMELMQDLDPKKLAQ
jgi:class 3 adenylate cyclase